MTAPVISHDIIVIGGGPAGLAAALAVVERGRPVALLAPDIGARGRDTRTTAILGDGITLLDNLGVWAGLKSVSAPLRAIRIVDDRGGWLAAPEVLFQAHELDREAFGYNVPNEALVAALAARAGRHPQLALIPTRGVTAILPGEHGVRLDTAESGVFQTQLVIAADGRQSLARAAAGLAARTWAYDQVAIVASFSHTRPHDGISTELHRRSGPLTTVPLPDDSGGTRSALVWVETAAESQHLMALDDAAFGAALEMRLKGLLGRVRNVGARGTFPITGLMATAVGKGRIVLAGEAAHVLPPIGAQGLNLGFRDAAAIADAVADFGGGDAGDAAVIAAYGRARAADLVSREIGIDLLARSLSSNFFGVQAMRGLGLHALANSRTLRRAAMQMGLQPPGVVPQLMRPLAKVEPA